MRCCDGLVRLERRLALTVKRLQYNAVSSPGSAAQPSLLGVMGGCARCCTEALAEHRQADLALRLPRGLSVVQQPARASNPITTVGIVIPQLPGHLILRYPSCPGPAPCRGGRHDECRRGTSACGGGGRGKTGGGGAHAARATGQSRPEIPTGGLVDRSMSYPARCCFPALALAAW